MFGTKLKSLVDLTVIESAIDLGIYLTSLSYMIFGVVVYAL